MSNEPLTPATGTRDEQRVVAESAMSEAERLGRTGEEERELRDRRREEREMVRQERERQREAAEAGRVARDEARLAADAVRDAAIDRLHRTAEALQAALEHMKIVEEMRRTLHDLGGVNRRDSN